MADKTLNQLTEDSTPAGTDFIQINKSGADYKRLVSSTLVNDLTTGGTAKGLTAEQGKMLQDNKVNTSDIATNLTTDDDTKVLSAKQGKTLQDNKIAIADIDTTPSNSNTKVIASSFAYKQSTQDGDWYKEYTSTADVGSWASHNQWEYITGHTLSLSAGTWKISYKVILNSTYATKSESIICGLSTENASNVTANLPITICFFADTSAGTGFLITGNAEIITTQASAFNVYLKARPNGTGTLTSLITRGTIGTTYIRAQRLY